SGCIARDGGSAVNITVPPITLAAETISAAGGDSSVATTAVSSGPSTKISSISTESSAYADGISSGRSRRSAGHIERRTDEVGGIAKPARKPHATSTATGAPASALATISPSAVPCTRP